MATASDEVGSADGVVGAGGATGGAGGGGGRAAAGDAGGDGSCGGDAARRPLELRELLRVYQGPSLSAAALELAEKHLAGGLDANDMTLVPVVAKSTPAATEPDGSGDGARAAAAGPGGGAGDRAGAGAPLSREAMLRHFAGRYPVYYGHPVTGMYSASACEELGLASNDLSRSSKYVVGGPVLHGRDDLASGRPSRFHVIHAYAPNLESASTPDALALLSRSSGLTGVFGAQVLDEAAYRALLAATLDAVAECARRMGVRSVALPLIGQGAFLSACGRGATDAANAIFADELRRVAAEARSHEAAPVDFVLFVMSAADKRRYARPGVRIEVGSLFNAHKKLEGALALVNAWDDQSLIGNGLSRDPTIDGWMVAGSGHGAPFANSSFAHNVALLRARPPA